MGMAAKLANDRDGQTRFSTQSRPPEGVANDRDGRTRFSTQSRPPEGVANDRDGQTRFTIQSRPPEVAVSKDAVAMRLQDAASQKMQSHLNYMTRSLDRVRSNCSKTLRHLETAIQITAVVEICLNTSLLIVQGLPFMPLDVKNAVTTGLSALLAIIKGIEMKMNPDMRAADLKETNCRVASLREQLISASTRMQDEDEIQKTVRVLTKKFQEILSDCVGQLLVEESGSTTNSE